ncbi:MAG: hypothetical protein KVP17_002996 [Porospora cf. gigantea B]|uniref:uncharacterized protein n=1 Tax=Porospora cf. gigantea B TaxID=2853592 RepID=UPI0035719381|nr:MAG: hypothetical protein KVP17_002996 [Porospora cf. gigantea B]
MFGLLPLLVGAVALCFCLLLSIPKSINLFEAIRNTGLSLRGENNTGDLPQSTYPIPETTLVEGSRPPLFIFSFMPRYGWGDNIGGLTQTKAAAKETGRLFFVDSPDQFIANWFIPRDWNNPWNVTRLDLERSLVKPRSVMLNKSLETQPETSDRRPPRDWLDYYLSRRGEQTYRGDLEGVLENPVLGTRRIVTAQQPDNYFVPYFRSPYWFMYGYVTKGYEMAYNIRSGRAKWSDFHPQRDAVFSLFALTRHAVEMLERTVARTLFLVDFADADWKPGSSSSFQHGLKEALEQMEPLQKAVIVRRIVEGLADHHPLSPFTDSLAEASTLSHTLKRRVDLLALEAHTSEEAFLRFCRNELLPALGEITSLHYRAGDGQTWHPRHHDKRNPLTAAALRGCIASKRGPVLVFSDSQELKDQVAADVNVLPVSQPDYKLLHNDSAASGSDPVWGTTVIEWLLMMWSDQMVVTYSGFGGTAALFLPEDKIMICKPDAETSTTRPFKSL